MRASCRNHADRPAVRAMTTFDHFIRITDRLGQVADGSPEADRTIHTAIGVEGTVQPYTTDETAARLLLPVGFEWREGRAGGLPRYRRAPAPAAGRADAAPSAAWRLSSSPPSNGWTGTTTAASSSRLVTSRLPRPKRATMPPSKGLRWRPDPSSPASSKPGAVQRAEVPGRPLAVRGRPAMRDGVSRPSCPWPGWVWRPWAWARPWPCSQARRPCRRTAWCWPCRPAWHRPG